MRSSTTRATAVALLQVLGLSLAQGQLSRTCPASDLGICFSINVPDATAQSGSGDIYFQIEAPSSSHQWVALGQGSQMRGAHIFVAYLSADGTNVTVSPRLGVGHVQPTHDDSTSQSSQITLLEGSGVANGTMTANVRCGGCSSWNGGTMDFTSSSASWIFASRSGTPIQSDDLDENISIHNDHGVFNWDLSAAKGGDTLVNPFITSASASTQNTTTTTTSTTTTGSGPSSSSGAGGGPSQAIITAHAIFACLTVALVLPIGGILIRTANFSRSVVVHSAIQYVGTAMYTVAFGLGAYCATQDRYWNNHHPIIGTVILALILCQPALGFLHHKSYQKVQRRGILSWAHLSLGRIVIFLGIINGGLGLQLAGAGRGAMIGYGVGAGVVGLLYLGAIIFGENKRRRMNAGAGVRTKG